MGLLAAACLFLLAQAPGVVEPRLLTFGTVASRLTADDHRQINRLATRLGGSVWVMFGDLSGWMAQRVWSVEVHKKPSVVSGGVRTGEVIWIAADFNPGELKRQWRIEGAGVSGQVPLPDRSPDDITSDMDANRPFRLLGQWRAEELAVLVAFIRSSPRAISPKRGATVNGTLPISSISRDADGTTKVSLRVKADELAQVVLRRQGETWEVMSVTVVAID